MNPSVCLMFRVVITTVLASGSYGCADQDSIADLLSIPRSSAEAMSVDEFNAQLARDPGLNELIVARQFARLPLGRQAVAAVTRHDSSRSEVILIEDGFDDDSVRGERVDLRLEWNEDRGWRVVEAKKSWRCWDGRGQTDFGASLCH